MEVLRSPAGVLTSWGQVRKPRVNAILSPHTGDQMFFKVPRSSNGDSLKTGTRSLPVRHPHGKGRCSALFTVRVAVSSKWTKSPRCPPTKPAEPQASHQQQAQLHGSWSGVQAPQEAQGACLLSTRPHALQYTRPASQITRGRGAAALWAAQGTTESGCSQPNLTGRTHTHPCASHATYS